MDGSWKEGDKIDVRYPMSLRVETTSDDPSRVALLYGPIVLAGNLGTEGMIAPASFSDPTIRNDYYTYDYSIPEELDFNLNVDEKNPTLSVVKQDGEGLKFHTFDGREIIPLYDAHHCRYVVYWNLTVL